MKKHLIGYSAVALVALVVGISTSGSSGATTVAAPAVTKTVDRPVAPSSCLEALDIADRGFVLAGEGFTAAADGFRAAADFDLTALKFASAELSDATNRITTLSPDYHAAKAQCRAAQ